MADKSELMAERSKGRLEEKERVLELIRLKCLCRIRGLKLDIENGYKFEGRLQEYEELLRHLKNLKWIEADIECAMKYLSDKEKEKFKKLKTRYVKTMEARHSSQP